MTVTEAGLAPKLTTFAYTPRGQRASQTNSNGNGVEFTYHLDGLLHTQTETQPDGTLVASHEVDYDPNSNRSHESVQVQHADNPAAHLENVYSYAYDPRDRVTRLTRTPAGGAAKVEEYVYYDANDNVVSETIDGITTTATFDRNRLQSRSAAGVTASFIYDPFGRLDTVTVGDDLAQRYVYDGFDRVVEHRVLGSQPATTRHTYDPFDRTVTRVDKAGSVRSRQPCSATWAPPDRW